MALRCWRSLHLDKRLILEQARSISQLVRVPEDTPDDQCIQIGAGNQPVKDEIRHNLLSIARERNLPIPSFLEQEERSSDNLPKSVQALYLAPLRRKPTHGNVVANLQLRSYSARNLELMADFAMRAAYYLNLPAKGPVPLPRMTQRWTVPKSHFIFKKNQENFERVTMRRLVQILDGHPESVRRWLGFIRKWCWYGVGMKADVYDWEDTNIVKRMDELAEKTAQEYEDVEFPLLGRRKFGERTDTEELLDFHGFGKKEDAKIVS